MHCSAAPDAATIAVGSRIGLIGVMKEVMGADKVMQITACYMKTI